MTKKLVMCIASGHPSDCYVAIPGQIYMVTDVDHEMGEYEISRPGWETWDRVREPMDNFEVIESFEQAEETLSKLFDEYKEAARGIYAA